MRGNSSWVGRRYSCYCLCLLITWLLANTSAETCKPSIVALANLIRTYNKSTTRRLYRREDCACLVALTNLFISEVARQGAQANEDWQTFNESEVVSTVVDVMIAVAQTSLERSYTNCGSYKGLPWLSALALVNAWLISPEQLGRLGAVLRECNQRGLFTEDVRAQLRQIPDAGPALLCQSPALDDSCDSAPTVDVTHLHREISHSWPPGETPV